MNALLGQPLTKAPFSRTASKDRAVHRNALAEVRPASRPDTQAAQYIRMSTEHQQYSTHNQIAAIRQYADRHGLSVVRTYADEGKSGVRLNGRDALIRLIKDVQDGTADYEVILVYDVSRWGRFQDADESAYYEYICRRAGLSVQYCAEMFDNDGSPISTIIKGIKRAMAGEYSRELSVKVFAGQSRLARMGFHVGAVPGFGLRRMLIDQHGVLKGELATGQHKSISTDRVILAPGPACETEVVRWVYHAFVHEHRRVREILQLLVKQGVPTHDGKPWSYKRVHVLLTSPKYAGDNVWNRVSTKLGHKQTGNSPEMWVRREIAFEPIIDRDLFNAAKEIIQGCTQRLSDQQLLDSLRALYERHRCLSSEIINQSHQTPRASTYTRRFGSLMRAYEMIGWNSPQDYRAAEVQKALRAVRTAILTKVVALIKENGSHVDHNPRTDVLTVSGELTIGLLVASCCRRKHRRTPCWDVSFDLACRPDVTLIVRMDQPNRGALDYYLLPREAIKRRTMRLTGNNGLHIDAYRFESLAALQQMCRRMPLRNIP